jgi:hypothetical protein
VLAAGRPATAAASGYTRWSWASKKAEHTLGRQPERHDDEQEDTRKVTAASSPEASSGRNRIAAITTSSPISPIEAPLAIDPIWPRRTVCYCARCGRAEVVHVTSMNFYTDDLDDADGRDPDPDRTDDVLTARQTDTLAVVLAFPLLPKPAPAATAPASTASTTWNALPARLRGFFARSVTFP